MRGRLRTRGVLQGFACEICKIKYQNNSFCNRLKLNLIFSQKIKEHSFPKMVRTQRTAALRLFLEIFARGHIFCMKNHTLFFNLECIKYKFCFMVRHYKKDTRAYRIPIFRRVWASEQLIWEL